MRRHDEGTVGPRARRRAVLWAPARGLALVCVFGLVCVSVSPARAAPPDDTEAPAADTDQDEPPSDAPDTQDDCDPELDHCEPAEPQTAGQWYARGYELGNAGDYTAAAEAFMRSYELQPTSEALFNGALALENAGETITAIETYERFLAEPGRNEELAPAAELSIDALTRQLAVLKGLRYVQSRPPVELFVRGEAVELDGFPLLVLPGSIEVEVVDEQGVHARETYELLAGEAMVVDLRALLPELAPEPELVIESGPSEAELAAARARARSAIALRKVTWVGVGLTAATGISAITMGALAQRHRRLFDRDSCYQFEGQVCPPDFELGDPELHRDTYESYTLTTAILSGVTAGLAVATVTIAIVSLRRGRPARHPGGRASVHVIPGPSSLTLNF